MEVRIESLVEGAQRARGTAIIVDVFRAFTTAAVALDRGAKQIILVDHPETALQLRESGAGDLCMGEVGGKRPSGFDFGNSPFELSRAKISGRALIQSTRAGTVGACAATGADDMYAASLITAQATADAVCRSTPERVTIVAMGTEGKVRADEDELCALYLRNLIIGLRTEPEALRSLILAGKEAAKFEDPALPHFHPKDRDIALSIDALPFAIRIHREQDLLVARPVAASANNFQKTEAHYE